jgi:guanine nucleotide-binding protein subunit beta-2-like 1 protein
MERISKVEIEEPFYIEGHKQMITSMVAGVLRVKDNVQPVLVTGGRDKKITVWNINHSAQENKETVIPKFTLTGHNHFVADLQLNSSNEILLSASWDGSMRLWNLVNGTCKQTFFGVNKEISACGISYDNRIVYSSGFDNITTIWNTQGQIKATTTENQHTDVISRMRVASIPDQSYYVTVSWDGYVKVWNKFCVC